MNINLKQREYWLHHHHCMRYANSASSRRMYTSHFTAWDVRKNFNAMEMDEYCSHLLEDIKAGNPPLDVSSDTARKLRRHCRDNRPGTDIRLLELLVSVLKDPGRVIGNNHPLHERLSTATAHTESVDTPYGLTTMQPEAAFVSMPIQSDTMSSLERTHEITTNAGLSGFTSIAGSMYPNVTSLDEPDIILESGYDLPPSTVNNFRNVLAEQQYNPLMETALPSQARDIIFAEFLALIREYYGSRASCYARDLQSGRSGARNIDVARSQAVWKSIKNAIYLLKKGNENLAIPLLRDTRAKIHDLCRLQSLDLLRELFDTLSISNTAIRNNLRQTLLSPFITATATFDPPDDILYRICLQLIQPWIRDDDLVAALGEIIDVAQTKLGLLNPEVCNLHRARIRLMRRKGDLAAALDLALSAQDLLEKHLDHDDPGVRSIMSERLYILNLLPEQAGNAFQLAQEIVQRTQQSEGATFPTQQAVHELEDLAEIYQKCNQPDQAFFWLQTSLAGAVKAWQDREGTIHIQDKIDEILGLLAKSAIG